MTDEHAPSVASDPTRGSVLRRLSPSDASLEDAFNRLARLAARFLNAPAAVVSLAEEDRQVVLGSVGLPDPLSSVREAPASASYCRYVVERGEPLVVADARDHPLFREHPMPLELGVVAYLGIPLFAADGQVLGSFCVVDGEPRAWTPEQVALLTDLSASVMTEIGLRLELAEREEAELARVDSERRLRQILDAMPVGAILADASGRLVWHNPAGQRIWGGLPMVELEHYGEYRGWWAATGERVRAEEWALARALRGEEVTGEVIDIQAFDGVRRTILNSAVPLRDSAGRITGAMAVFEDITETHAREAQDRQAQKMEAVGRLAGGIAHDFNNVLTAITGHIYMLLEEAHLSEQGRRDLRTVQEAVQRAASLTHQLLAFSRKQVMQPERFDLNGLVKETGRLLERLLGEDVELVTRPAPRGLWVSADSTQIQQVLINLAVNARDAMPHGGVLWIGTGSVEFDPEVLRRPHRSPGRYARLTVTDTGYGMDAETRSRIFDPFFTTKEPGRGTGLGLSTAHGIVEQSGGWIEVTSTPGVSTTFEVYLPLATQSAGASDAPAAAPSFAGQETVLLVEDEPMIRRMAGRVLERAGYRVLSAANGDEALQRSRVLGGRLDLLLTDVVMPRMSGVALAERMGAERPETRVLFISGYAPEFHAQNAAIPADMWLLNKPFTPVELLQKVRAVLESPAPGPEPARSD